MRRRLAKWGIAYTVLAIIACASPLHAQPAAKPESDSSLSDAQAMENATAAPATADLERWIEQLGADSFAEREAATAAIYRMGPAVLPALRRLDRNDLERWTRAQRIADRIEREQFDQLAKSFLLDSDPSQSYGLPAWEAFAACAGASRSAKLLFLDMLRMEPELADRIDEIWRAAKAGEDVTKRVEMLRAVLAEKAGKLWQDRMHLRVPHIGQFVALLLGVSLLSDQQHAPKEVNSLMQASVHMVPLTSYLNRRGYSSAMRRLIGVWIPKSDSTQAEFVLQLALQYDIESGGVVARRSLKSGLDARTRQLAIMNLVRFGNASDVPRLFPMLRDTTVCELYEIQEDAGGALRRDGIPEVPPGGQPPNLPPQQDNAGVHGNFKILRLCDLAFAAALLLSGERVDEFFPRFQLHEVYGIDGRSIACLPSPDVLEQRSKQIEHWIATHRQKQES